MKVGLIGWRGMVGSVLMQRMVEENDFAHIEPVYFTTSAPGAPAPSFGGKAAGTPDLKPEQPGTPVTSDVSGSDTPALVGTAATTWFETPARDMLRPHRADAVRTRIRGSMVEDQLVEMTARAIEYRGRAATVVALRDLTEAGDQAR